MEKRTVKRKRFSGVKTARFTMTAILMIVSGFLIFSIGKEVLVTVNLTQDLQVLENQLKSIEDETRDLQERKEKLEDPNYIKSYARGEYSITKEGEQVFRLPSSNNKVDPDANEESDDN